MRYMIKSRTVLIICILALLLSNSQAGSVSSGSNEWNRIGPEGGVIEALAVDPLSPETLYVGTWGGGVYKSTNGGDNWDEVNNGLWDNYIKALAIDPLTPSTLYAGEGKEECTKARTGVRNGT